MCDLLEEGALATSKKENRRQGTKMPEKSLSKSGEGGAADWVS